MTRVSKRFVAGAGSCLATANAITDLDFEVNAGESVAVVGPGGAGKTTLLLCAAGLLAPDAGCVRWFGQSDRGAALARARLHYHRSTLAAGSASDVPLVHLVDLGDEESLRAREWIELQRTSGAAVVVALRDADAARSIAQRVVSLRKGRVVTPARASARVAERVSLTPPVGAPRIHAPARAASRCVRLPLHPPTKQV